MEVTAQQHATLGVIDKIVPEPVGGAHRDPTVAIQSLQKAIVEDLRGLDGLGADQLRRQRADKFLAMGS